MAISAKCIQLASRSLILHDQLIEFHEAAKVVNALPTLSTKARTLLNQFLIAGVEELYQDISTLNATLLKDDSVRYDLAELAKAIAGIDVELMMARLGKLETSFGPAMLEGIVECECGQKK